MKIRGIVLIVLALAGTLLSGCATKTRSQASVPVLQPQADLSQRLQGISEEINKVAQENRGSEEIVPGQILINMADAGLSGEKVVGRYVIANTVRADHAIVGGVSLLEFLMLRLALDVSNGHLTLSDAAEILRLSKSAKLLYLDYEEVPFGERTADEGNTAP